MRECTCSCADEASCGSPRWIGKSLSCVCIKRKGAYERICMNLTPVQVWACEISLLCKDLQCFYANVHRQGLFLLSEKDLSADQINQ